MTDPAERFTGSTILVAPLDWGLGHASRCVPLVRKLSVRNRLIIGVTPVTKPTFDFYFPELEQATIPSYNIRYSRLLPQWIFLLLKLPAILSTVRKEKRVVRELIRARKIDVVISDNRYGARHKEVPSYFVCHQVRMMVPLLRGPLNFIHQRYLEKFTAVWIPDYPDHRLSGDLSRPRGPGRQLRAECIGPLSALAGCGETETGKFDLLILLSGPEPQRSMLEERLLRKLDGSSRQVALVRGVKSGSVLRQPANVTVYEFAAGALLRSLLLHSETVICRSGYSTLMDAHALGKKKLVLIPTPGQPEQEYLADHWQRAFGATVVKQKDIEDFRFLP